MSNRDNPNGFKIAYTTNNAPPLLKTYLLDESQSIKKHDAIKFSASGFVQLGVSTDNKLGGVSVEEVSSGAGVKTTEIDVFLPLPTTVFEGQCSETPGQALMMSECDIEGTSGIMEVNENANVKGHLKIIEFHPSDEAGANRRVRFIFNPAASQIMGAR